MEDFVNEDEAPRSTAEDLVDELLPEGLDWERLTRSYPLPAVLLAAVGGFLIGRRHGREIVAAVSGYFTAEVAKNVRQVLGPDIRLGRPGVG